MVIPYQFSVAYLNLWFWCTEYSAHNTHFLFSYSRPKREHIKLWNLLPHLSACTIATIVKAVFKIYSGVSLCDSIEFFQISTCICKLSLINFGVSNFSNYSRIIMPTSKSNVSRRRIGTPHWDDGNCTVCVLVALYDSSPFSQSI
jgi:hypothetical protein